ncbi:hypothetical protein RHMOL_Rhmol04G0345300 [Rhododendron molle]|uniref:Uncharacterized protein n=1 Tax=Rhododendron molle TaxID=49168 RepID=A0ACC0P7H5_RHOML|nr:hypothetical protein RHMOL_Rhmol04G0345300 [Rhododendron molle]
MCSVGLQLRMASFAAKASGSISDQVLPALPVQEKGSRNKRKFRADPPLGDTTKISLPQNECSSYKFSSEKFEITPLNGHPNGCDMCSMSRDHSDALKLDHSLSTAAEPSEVVPIWYREEVEVADEVHDADWSDLTESQLEELVLSNLDTIFKSAMEKIVANGYSEQVVTKAVLRNGQETALSREHYFDDLQQMEKYILTELVCVLREVRPFFCTGDAMWCLLICDMNVSYACAMDGDPLSTLSGDGGPNGNNSLNLGTRSSELDLPIPCNPNSSIACAHTCK